MATQKVDIGKFIFDNASEPTLDASFEELEKELHSNEETDDAGDGSVGVGGGEDVGTSPPQTDIREGEVFDPKIHCTNSDGTPRLTKSGKFRRRKGSANAVAERSVDLFNAPPDQNTVGIIMMGIDTVSLMLTKGIGAEWEFKPEEKQTLANVYARYAHYKGWDKAASPEVALIGVTCAVLFPRIMHPNTMGKLKLLFGRKKTNGTYLNLGANGNGKNHTGKGDRSTGGGPRFTSDSIGPDEKQGMGQEN